MRLKDKSPARIKCDAIDMIYKAADMLSLVYHQSQIANEAECAGAAKHLLMQIANALQNGSCFPTLDYAKSFDEAASRA